jgi:Skp family chaperone for outer membrane proteins
MKGIIKKTLLIVTLAALPLTFACADTASMPATQDTSTAAPDHMKNEMGPKNEEMQKMHEEMKAKREHMQKEHEEMKVKHEQMQKEREEMKAKREQMQKEHEEMREERKKMHEMHDKSKQDKMNNMPAAPTKQ